MFQNAPVASVKLAMMLMIVGGTVEGAPTERGEEAAERMDLYTLSLFDPI